MPSEGGESIKEQAAEYLREAFNAAFAAGHKAGITEERERCKKIVENSARDISDTFEGEYRSGTPSAYKRSSESVVRFIVHAIMDDK